MAINSNWDDVWFSNWDDGWVMPKTAADWADVIAQAKPSPSPIWKAKMSAEELEERFKEGVSQGELRWVPTPNDPNDREEQAWAGGYEDGFEHGMDHAIRAAWIDIAEQIDTLFGTKLAESPDVETDAPAELKALLEELARRRDFADWALRESGTESRTATAPMMRALDNPAPGAGDTWRLPFTRMGEDE